MKRYWRYMAFLQNKFTGSTEKSNLNRKNALTLLKVRVSSTPNISQIRKVHTQFKIRSRKEARKMYNKILELEEKRAAKELDEFGNITDSHIDYEYIEDQVRERMADTIWGDFAKELHET